ncbi:MAG TPA: molybdopterin-dependent oxidoreductase [Intrasporangium sp.]|nr:molybdopterin-dependent oxidoreductase [Intrasporangium sp.]
MERLQDAVPTARPEWARTRAMGAVRALAAMLATVLAIAAGQLAAALFIPATAPVLAVGSVAIDATPTPVKDWAVSTFGTSDKTFLVGGVVVVTLMVAATAGVLSRGRRWPVPLVLVVLGLLGGLAAASRPTATAVDVVPSGVATLVGLAGYCGLVGLIRRRVRSESRTEARPPGGLSRRRFLLGSVAAAATSAALFLLSRGVEAGRTIRSLALPGPASPAQALPLGLEAQVHGISSLQTPSDRFYRVDTNLTVPDVDPAGWSLSIDGMVEHPYSLTLDELLGMPLVERDITMTCVSNEVGGPYVGSARWLGVRLTDLLGRAGTTGRSNQLLSTAVDGFTISTPLSVATDGRDAMVAVGMNGAALPSAHGFPARLLVPGLYGFVGATKWLTRLTLTTYTARQAYWTRRQWAIDAPVKTGSRIDTPVALATIPPGRTPIGGVAWAQHRGVSRVEVRIDDGPWQPARLGPDVGSDYWRQWWLPWDATSGMHRLAVRATDGHGVTQPATRATPFPDGASGIPDVLVTVA